MDDDPWLQRQGSGRPRLPRGLQGVHDREAAPGGAAGGVLVGHREPEARKHPGVGALHDRAPELADRLFTRFLERSQQAGPDPPRRAPGTRRTRTRRSRRPARSVGAAPLRGWRAGPTASCRAGDSFVVRDDGAAGADAPSSASATSPALAKRSSGRRSRHRRIAASHGASSSGTWTRGLGGGSRRRLIMMLIGVSPVKGHTPVTIS